MTVAPLKSPPVAVRELLAPKTKKYAAPRRYTVMVLAIALYFASPGLITGLGFSAGMLAAVLAVPPVLLFAILASSSKIAIWWRPAPWVAIFMILFSGLYGLAIVTTMTSEGLASIAATNLLLLIALSLPGLLAAILCVSLTHPDYRYPFFESALVKALVLLLLTQCALTLTGVRHEQFDQIPQTRAFALAFGSLGLDVRRFLLPISSGMHNALVIPALLAAIAFSRYSYNRRLTDAAMLVFSMVILLLVDSRTAIAAVPIAIIVYFTLRQSPWLLALAGSLLPTLLFVSLAFRDLLPGLVDLASGRYDTSGAFSGREHIWASFWNYVGRADLGQLVMGNGLYGQAAAGISIDYNYLFSSFSDAARELASLHNSYLQMWADIGLAGLAAYAIGTVTLIRRLAFLERTDAENYTLWRGLTIFTLALQFIASSEVTLTPYSKEGFLALLFVWMFVAFFGGARRTIENRVIQR